MDWQAERKSVREKRKKQKENKKKEEIDSIIQSLNQQKKQKKKAKRDLETSEDADEPAELPVPNELGLKSILRNKNTPSKGHISFSPQLVQIKAIPRVKNPTPVSLTLSRIQLRNATPPKPRRKMSRKAKLVSKRRR